MRNYIKYSALLLIILVSCEKKSPNKYEKLIVGDWIFEKESPKEKGRFYSDFSYSFTEKGNCETNPGFYETKEMDENGERKKIFYGTKTKYKIVDDSLFINNLITKKWDAAKIVDVNFKSLKLCFDKNIIIELSKQKYIDKEKDNFDKIIISKSPCFGPCPINDIEINKNGEIVYNGAHWNMKNGFFRAKITPQEFMEIEKNFKKTNFMELNDEYIAGWTDDQEVTVTFINDNKILKTIKDYGRQSPKSFRITYEPITYLYQKLKLKEYKNRYHFEKMFLEFEKGNEIISLENSEVFYLSNLLKNAKQTTKSCKTEYTINYDNSIIKRIETDGQFYKVVFKKESPIILDLGFNFIKTNNLKERLKLKEELDE